MILAALLLAGCGQTARERAPDRPAPKPVQREPATPAVVQKALSQLLWLQRNRYSQRIILLADLNLPMNAYRLFLVDLEKKKVLHRSVMAHGSGRGSTIEDAVCSNEPGSNCSSLGRYRFGENYNGRWGNSFRLHGLDPGNSKALQRAIVFHYYEHMTDDPETGSLYYSEGCPMVPKRTYRLVKNAIEKEALPVVLWMYK